MILETLLEIKFWSMEFGLFSNHSVIHLVGCSKEPSHGDGSFETYVFDWDEEKK